MQKWKNFLSLILVIVFLTGCDELPPIKEYSDFIFSHKFTESCGVAFGGKGIYVVYGTLNYLNRNIGSGAGVDSKGLFTFSILKVLKQNPELRTEKSIKAAAAQQLVFKKRLPDFYDPSELSSLGAHINDF